MTSTPADSTPDDAGEPGPTTRFLLRAYLLFSGLGFVAGTTSLLLLPAELQHLDAPPERSPEEVHAAAEGLYYDIDETLPVAGGILASDAIHYLGYDLDRLRPPTRGTAPDLPRAEDVIRFNAGVDAVRDEYSRAVMLLLSVCVLGILFGMLALRRARMGTSIMLCVVPLLAIPGISEPLAAVGTEALIWITSPLLLAGGAVLAIRVTHQAFEHALRTRRDHWLEIWFGGILLVVGGGVTIVGIANVASGARVLTLAVVPTLYGLWTFVRGFSGLLRRRRSG